jgi:hypothetical protein
MAMIKLHVKREYLIIGILALIKLMFHLLTNTNYDLHRDTFLYYSFGQHLDWGYVSNPPFIGIIAWLSEHLFGASAFGLNLFPALIGAISVVIISLIVKEFGGGYFAIILSNLVYIISPAYLRTDTLFQPVAFDQFFWLLSSLFIVKLLKTNQPKFWLYIFLVWAVGFLNKYLMAAYAISFLISMLLIRERKLLFSKYFAIGCVLGFIIILPNLLWQFYHNLPVIHHLDQLNQSQLINVSISGFILDQLLMNIPGLIVWLTGLIYLFISKNERKYLALAFTSVFVIIMLLLLHGKSYYTLGLYPFLFAAGGYFIERKWSKSLQYVVVVSSILIAVPALPFSLPVLSFEKLESYTRHFKDATNRWEDGNVHNIPQDYADMTGWKELGNKVVKIYDSLPLKERINCAIYAENYGQAGAIKFYGKKFGLPEPICFCDNFILWAPDIVTKRNLIYINSEIGDIKYLFKNYELKAEITNKYFRECGLKVYYCTQPIDSFQIFYRLKVRKIKQTYNISK